MAKGVVLRIIYMDGQERHFHVGPDKEFKSWKMHTTWDVPELIIGRGVPRVQIALTNVRLLMVEPELETEASDGEGDTVS